MFKVLIVEDEWLLRKGLEETVDWQKYQCVPAGSVENGRKAIEFLKQNEVDIILTDIRMPVMDGLTMIEEVEKRIPNYYAYVILTAYNDFEYAQTALKHGVSDFLVKPFKDEDFESAIMRAKEHAFNKQKNHQYYVYSQDIPEIISMKKRIQNPDLIQNVLIKQAVKIIHLEYYNYNLTLEDISDSLGVSRRHLTRLFNRTISMSYQEYLSNYRIFQACKLLLKTNMLIYEVAESVGYQDSQYFTTIFKKHIRMTPKDFRLKYQSF